MCYTTLDHTGIAMGDLPTWISAFASITLAFITYRYVRLVKEQSDTMAEQGKIMRASMERDQLTKKYERLVKEMDNLIGPLYSKMDDHTAPFFTAVTHSSEGGPVFQEIYAFWRDIKKNMYLAPGDLRECLINYLDARQKYRKARRDYSTAGEELTAVKILFDQSITELTPKIQKRYDELRRTLERYERELES